MSYLVLARKWRPQKFADVIGQDHVVHTLQNAVKKDRLAHAFLFTGARGVGKTTAARLLAKALQCEQGPTPEPCGTCTHCIEIAESRSVDVLEIDGASNRGIDQVRELRDGVRYLPQSARHKIIIIDEVHMFTTEAFNALLKTLEEPPEHVKFIFATTEPHKIPITILSRCQRFDFKRIATGEIVKHLRRIIDQEKIVADDEALHQIARAGQGSMRDALSLMDQAIAYADDAVTSEVASEALGIIDRRIVVAIVEAVLAQDSSATLETVAKAFKSGADLRQLLSDIIEEIRHLIVVQAVAEPGPLIDLPGKEIEFLQQRAAQVPAEDLQRLFAMAQEQVDVIARAESPRMLLDVLLARMAAMPSYRSLDELSALIDRLSGKGPQLVRKKPAKRQQAVQRAAPDSRSVSASSQATSRDHSQDHSQDHVVAPAGLMDSLSSSKSSAIKPPAVEPPAPKSSPAEPDSAESPVVAFATPAIQQVDKVAETKSVVNSDEAKTVGAESSPLEQVEVSPLAQAQTAKPGDSEKHLESPVAAREKQLNESVSQAVDVLPGVDPRWQAVVEQVRAENPAAASFLEFGVVDIDASSEHVILRFAQRFYVDSLRDSEKFKVLNSAAKTQFPKLEKLEIEVSTLAEGSSLSVAAAKSREQEDARATMESEALANPTVRLAIKMFNAKVLEVNDAKDDAQEKSAPS